MSLLIIKQPDEEEGDKLRIENVAHEDEGWYTCIAANSLGTTTAKAYLQVVDGKIKQMFTKKFSFANEKCYQFSLGR